MDFRKASTGIYGLDQILDDLRLGDNVVWQVDRIEDYFYFARAFASSAIREHKTLIYFRFGGHQPILTQEPGLKICPVDASRGFEHFSTAIREIITGEGQGAYYIFDSLSELLSEWSNDLMIGNFFLVTCPYLFQLDTIAYFALLRNSHSYRTIARIRDTTQLLLDVYWRNDYYVHPLKVWKRYSPTMFLPHATADGGYIPLTDSAEVAKFFSDIPVHRMGNVQRRLDYWDHLFLKAADLNKEVSEGNQKLRPELNQLLEHLLQITIGRDEKILQLARNYLTIEDLLQIKSRFIGSGYIGGKAAGLLLSRAILKADASYNWPNLLEPHDSFYVGSDVYYTYLVENNCWQLRQEQKAEENYFPVAQILREKMTAGSFPEVIREQLVEMLEYFGQSPIIVRSSSLLEDGFGNAFAGKYESVFCTNQGNLQERYEQLINAIRRVYASTMNEDALAYRLQRGLAESDEQMALLIQRVSGSYRKSYYFPDLAGVALSYNPYVWKPEMNPEAGMLRLVLGLGTRAVDRTGEDYARLVALDFPLLTPAAGQAEKYDFTQQSVDLLDLTRNIPETLPFQTLVEHNLVGHLNTFAVSETNSQMPGRRWFLTFDELLSHTDFPSRLRKMLGILQTAYGYLVDTEFTANFRKDGSYSLNLLQCRPLQVKRNRKHIAIPKKIGEEQILFTTIGRFLGNSLELKLSRIIYIVPEQYALLTQSDKYQVARIVGKLNRLIANPEDLPTVLLGPGRWGTSTPSLGIPVSFAEINKMSVIGEIAFQTAGFVPEISYGTHFFQDLVETDIFYLILNEQEQQTTFNRRLLSELPNVLTSLLPDTQRWESSIKVIDTENTNGSFWLYADITQQKVICWKRGN